MIPFIVKKQKVIFLIIVFTVVLFIGIFLGRYFWSVPKAVITTQIREDSSEYHFINPLLLVSNKGAGDALEYKSITKTLTDYVNKKIAQNKAEDISIYFRDLNSGLYSGVNEDHLYSPASMMKVAVLIECYKLGENDPTFFDQNVSMNFGSDNLNANQFYKSKNPVVAGKVYTVQELIDHMIVDSDNNAAILLEDLIGKSKIDDLLKELQLPDLSVSDFMSPQLYSRLYRILYNSTYLSPDVSEKTLFFLVNKSFPQGLSSSVPDNINVAQKFGERTLLDQSGHLINKELHDCGIVYLSNDPYFLCIMTKGQDFAELQPIISDVSKMVWSYFSSIKS